MGKQVVEGPGLFPAAVNINGTDEAYTIELIRRDGIVLTERVTEADTDNIVRVRDQYLPTAASSSMRVCAVKITSQVRESRLPKILS